VKELTLACAKRNNNLLTSHARNATCYLASAHAFELPLSLFLHPYVCLCAPQCFSTGSRSACQPQLSFIVSTIYGSVYIGDDGDTRTVPGRPSPKFRAIHQCAIARIFSLATAWRTTLRTGRRFITRDISLTRGIALRMNIAMSSSN